MVSRKLEIKPKNYIRVENNRIWVLKNIYNIEKIQYEKVIS
jgi:hypothetical protein